MADQTSRQSARRATSAGGRPTISQFVLVANSRLYVGSCRGAGSSPGSGGCGATGGSVVAGMRSSALRKRPSSRSRLRLSSAVYTRPCPPDSAALLTMRTPRGRPARGVPANIRGENGCDGTVTGRSSSAFGCSRGEVLTQPRGVSPMPPRATRSAPPIPLGLGITAARRAFLFCLARTFICSFRGPRKRARGALIHRGADYS